MKAQVNPGTLQFLLGMHLNRMGQATCNPAGEAVYLDAEIMWLSALCRPLVEEKSKAAARFREEWAKLLARTKPADKKATAWEGEQRFEQAALFVKLAYDANVLKKAPEFYDAAPDEEAEEEVEA